MFRLRVAANFAGLVQARGRFAVPHFYATADTGVMEYLLKVEKDGEEYYRKLAKDAGNPGFKYIFNMLADEEAKHYKAIEAMVSSGEQTLANSAILGETKNTFEKLRADPNAKITATRDQVELYIEARAVEASNRDEYLKRAQQVTDPKTRALFQLVAAEEQKHYVMLDELIQFIQKAEPGTGTWAESAEFNRLDDALYDNYKY
jgi:rubrerythrin|eukprot:TRINITY_DN219_c0_g1_i1.p1 TRINITY_DN219_c0_g1~~TRINITY_DN219_c0_g1_i1.p1  ORF type:complete len:216 (-),score=41.57 TRINITY_DN219_c0_g1_i1:199-810(-)